MYATPLGDTPAVRITDWFNWTVHPGDVVRLVYTARGGVTAPAKDIGELLKMRGFVPQGYPPTGNRTSVGIDVVALQSGKFGPLIGRYVYAGNASIEHQITSVIRIRTVDASTLDKLARNNKTQLAHNETIVKTRETVKTAAHEVATTAADVAKAAGAGVSHSAHFIEFLAKNIVPIALIGGGILAAHEFGVLGKLTKHLK